MVTSAQSEPLTYNILFDQFLEVSTYMLPTKAHPFSSLSRMRSQQLVTYGNVGKSCRCMVVGDAGFLTLLFLPYSRYRSWGLLGLHPFCGVMFTAGYALRAYGAFNYIYNDSALLVYILSQVFIYICP